MEKVISLSKSFLLVTYETNRPILLTFTQLKHYLQSLKIISKPPSDRAPLRQIKILIGLNFQKNFFRHSLPKKCSWKTTLFRKVFRSTNLKRKIYIFLKYKNQKKKKKKNAFF